MLDLILLLPFIVFSIILHEVAHGFVAYGQGDDTAHIHGRLTLNPIPHIDPIGSIILPVICKISGMPIFGWAKPVPVDPSRFNNYRSGVFLVALAGPLTNLLIAAAFTFVLSFVISHPNLLAQFSFLPRVLNGVIVLNIVLAVFNLIPLPPLDGSRVASALLPADLAEQYDRIEPYGFFILMGLMFTGILGRFIYPAVDAVYKLYLQIFGVLA